MIYGTVHYMLIAFNTITNIKNQRVNLFQKRVRHEVNQKLVNDFLMINFNNVK